MELDVTFWAELRLQIILCIALNLTVNLPLHEARKTAKSHLENDKGKCGTNYSDQLASNATNLERETRHSVSSRNYSWKL